MRAFFAIALCMLGGVAAAQAPAGANSASSAQAVTTPTIRTNTRLVVVDVTVQTKNGKPVRDLTKDSFHLKEGGVAQTVRYFEEHSQQKSTAPAVEMPKLPPGTFTDYQPVPAGGTLNILLLDSLNTPAQDQFYVLNQLKDYVKHAAPGTNIAIFGLSSNLVLLQGFSSDPQTLKDAINHKAIPRFSTLLDDPNGAGSDSATPADLALGQTNITQASSQTADSAAANYQQFEAEIAATQLQLRLQYTLDAFNSLGHYLAAFPGRKNLIWFSGSFPLNILPSPGIGDPFHVANLDASEFRDTVNLLAKAQVAVYPVDARGLSTPPVYNAAGSGRRYGQNPTTFTADVGAFTSSQANEHSTMDVMAAATGGHAFYNTNALSSAVTQAIDAGSTYYTLAYSPTDKKEDGGYRKIAVDLSPSASSQGLQLSYRQGYYADDAEEKAHRPTATTSEGENAVNHTAAAFERAAMSRGAPTPQDLLFTARVLPEGTTLETELAPGNSLGVAVPPKGPFRNYVVDYVTLPKQVTMTESPDGRHIGKVEFIVYVFDVAGKLLNSVGKTVDLNLTPTSYRSFERGVIEAHLEISVPTKVETFLRIGVHDVPSSLFGAIEVPITSVNRLPVAVYPPGSLGSYSPGKDAGKPPAATSGVPAH